MTRKTLVIATILAGIIGTVGGTMSVTPASHGYPDFGRQLSKADIMIANTTQELNGIETIGTFFVGTTPYILINMSHAATHGIDLYWEWYTAVGGNLIGDGKMNTRTTAPNGGIVIPVLGPVIKFQGASNPDANNITLTVYAVPESSSPLMSTNVNVLISANATSVAAATTNTLNAAEVRAGWVYWHAAFEGSSAYRFKLFAVERDGTQHLLDFIQSGGTDVGRMVFVPPMPLRLESRNNDVAARDLYAVVTFHPFWH